MRWCLVAAAGRPPSLGFEAVQENLGLRQNLWVICKELRTKGSNLHIGGPAPQTPRSLSHYAKSEVEKNRNQAARCCPTALLELA